MVENGAFLPLAPPVDYDTTSSGQGWAQLRGPWAGGNLSHAHDHALCASPSAAVERRPAGQACRQHAIATEQQAPAVNLYHCILDIPNPVRRHVVVPRRQQRDRVIPGPQLSSRSATGGLQSVTSTPGELTSIAPAGGRLRSGPAGYSFAVIDLGACLTKSSLLRLAATGPASGAAAPSTTSESPASPASTAPTASLLSSSRRRRRADPEPD